MGAKEAFVEQMYEDLPDGIKLHLETPIPTLVATTSPTDVDSAIIAQGILAHNLNLIFKAFEGLTLAAIPMYIAQLNTVNQGILFAGLEYLGGGGEIRILSPTGGGAYLGYFGVREGEHYAAQIVRGTVEGISVALSGVQDGDVFDLEETEPGVWTAEWATGMGTHTATFTATFADGTTAEKSVSFAVVGYPTVPAENDIVPEGEVNVSINTGGDESIQGITVELVHEETGTSVILALVRVAEGFANVAELFEYGPYIASFKIALLLREYEQKVKFIYGQDPLSA